LSANDGALEPEKVACTLRATVTTTLQVPVPVQWPLQPVNVLPGSGVAVRTTVDFQG
jgi:hypothetical protein